MKSKIIYTAQLVCILFCSCEDLLVKEINVKQLDFPAMLSLTATLDSDETLTVSVSEARSLAYYSEYRPTTPNDRWLNGEVRLLEDGKEIFAKQERFNLSSDNLFQWTEIKTKVGATYRIELDVEDYPSVHSEAVMPEAPQVEEVVLEKSQREYGKVISIEPLDYGYSIYGSHSAYPLSFKIVDNSTAIDYYKVKVRKTFYAERREYSSKEDYEKYGDGMPLYSTVKSDTIDIKMGIADKALAQEHPDVESANLMMDEDNTGTYVVGHLIFTDATFRNSSRTVQSFIEQTIPTDTNDSYSTTQKPSDPFDEYGKRHSVSKMVLMVTRISENTYDTYRSMAFQLEGMDFFSEPVSIPSNIVGGVGCFSVQNSTQVVLYDIEAWCKY